jgi:ABC-type phosphate/phosphonate transport system substrate-binding protein
MKNAKEPNAPAGVTGSRRQVLAMLLGAWPGLRAAAAADRRPVLRLAISESLVGDVNLNDARASMVVWMRRIAQDLELDLQYDPQVFENSERLAVRVRQGQLDTVAINILEYRRMIDWLNGSQVVVPTQRTKLEYILLVRADAGISKLADLKGRRLMALKVPKACIAAAWLSNLLDGEESGGAERFFGSIVPDTKPARVILPVFFGQADACLTTSSSFATMSELNPQVAKRLRPLATSPEIVSSLYTFRRDWEHSTRDQMIRALADLRSSPSGRQVLTMFQCESLVMKDSSCLNNSLAILEQAERAGRNPAPKNPKGTRP